MIRPGGLLLAVLTYLQFQFYGWGCKRVHSLTWMLKIISEGDILSTAGDALAASYIKFEY
jgi:hypothetical protein